MTYKIPHKSIQLIDFLQFVDKNCCKKYLSSLTTYSMVNDITNEDVKKVFYHSIIECIITYFIDQKTLDKKVFYVDKLKLQSCCLIGDNNKKVFLKFFVEFIKKLKNNMNICFVCDRHSFKTYAEELKTDAFLQEELQKSISKKEIKSEKVYRFLDKNGLKSLSNIYKTETKVKFWLKQ